MRNNTQNSGFALLATVVILTLIVGIMATAFARAAGSRATSARRQLFMEQALFVAEAGAERAVGYLAASSVPVVPVALTNSVGDGSYIANIWLTNVIGSASRSYMIAATGTVKGVTRGIVIEGARQKSWARYAFWANDNRSIYFKSGEEFHGPVHVNSSPWFSGDPEFFDDMTSSATTFNGSTNACVFHRGLRLGTRSETMANVDFNAMKSVAGLVTTGATTIVFQGTNMVISNTGRGWTNRLMVLPTNSVIYVDTAGTSNGDIIVSGQLNGRVTVVAARDIQVVSNVTYVSDPATNSASDDALGLISGRDVVVTTAFPDNGKIYAHIMATGAMTAGTTDGSFGVQNYDSRHASGLLTVYGGIAQTYRGAVGTFNSSSGTLSTGFDKNYTYDERFTLDPPPQYPPISDQFAWSKWRAGR